MPERYVKQLKENCQTGFITHKDWNLLTFFFKVIDETHNYYLITGEDENINIWMARVGAENSSQEYVDWLISLLPATVEEQIESLKVAAQIATRDLVKAEELTEAEYNGLLAIYPKWEEGTTYKAGELVAYNGKLYEVLQAHTSQSDWTPDIVPALFVKREPAGVIPEWVQPTGAQDAYALVAIVTHNGQTWISTVADNVWEPGVYGWSVYTG
jgi:hypothetical protein